MSNETIHQRFLYDGTGHLATYEFVDNGPGDYLLAVVVDGMRYDAIASPDPHQRQAAYEDMLGIMREFGAVDVTGLR